ncbi:MAG TPA: polysaccharide biosynthesis C-terminal domain-containing protein [Vicinamibacterales bacterium]|nr:polysaccharide biosynthesis C-terminal domain-containing protein [Vicinamibacterales bacterium]
MVELARDTLPPHMACVGLKDGRTAQLVSYKVASEVVGKAVVLALLVVAARTLSPANFGVLSVATTLGWMAAAASDFGLQLYLGRAITQAADPASVLWPLFAIRIRAAAVALFLIGVFAWAVAPPGTWTASVLVAAAPLITSVAEFINYAYRGLGRSELESGLSLAQRVGALVLVYVGLMLSPTLLTVGLALTTSAVAALAASLVIAQRVVNSSSQPSPPLSGRIWLQDVAPIGAGLVLSALYFRVDVFLIEQWSGLEPVAHYSAVFRIVDAMRLLPAAVVTVVLPRLFGARDPTFARRLAGGLTAFAVLVTLVTRPLAAWLVAMTYGPAYAGAAPILQILLLSFPLLTLNYVLTHQLIGWNKPRAYALCCLAALVANLALNAWLIPEAAAIGAAWATLGTEVVVTLFCVIRLASLQRSHTSR